ncbi:hypothetical protein Hypma_007116 [Hypsizygus marmoreus]|uniref:Uncharacterized protein n=1 Tax=Hypsizygus marmoreus TaxID=39966 RepID=A0A369KBN3_HYPMA|nr:hypothetical protein Hypma_007116 [Hypsizygus marmoreus]
MSWCLSVTDTSHAALARFTLKTSAYFPPLLVLVQAPVWRMLGLKLLVRISISRHDLKSNARVMGFLIEVEDERSVELTT